MKIELEDQETSRQLEQTVTTDVAYLRTVFVNLYFHGKPGAPSGSWVLIDAGLPGSAPWILAAAEERFGRWAYPSAIILTHGPFDHVGALHTLLDRWDVPVYAHRLELPYLRPVRLSAAGSDGRRWRHGSSFALLSTRPV